MQLYSHEGPDLYHPTKTPCIVLSESETESFIGDDRAARNKLYDEARQLAESIQPALEEVLVYDPRGSVVTGITPGYRFVSSEMA